jgi:hypothetical protein
MLPAITQVSLSTHVTMFLAPKKPAPPAWYQDSMLQGNAAAFVVACAAIRGVSMYFAESN